MGLKGLKTRRDTCLDRFIAYCLNMGRKTWGELQLFCSTQWRHIETTSQIWPVQRLHRAFAHSYVAAWLWALRLRGLHAQLVAHQLKCRGDGLVHVVVFVAAQATGEDHVAFLCR